ncbi:hypothetical protein BC830DRAFT_1091501 [Chytriomyces sp. MP71]|nr:hypothetical protein BC830DRAFT_1091501 [Chytriomyces sp. MP71]
MKANDSSRPTVWCEDHRVKAPNPVSLSKHVRTPSAPASLLSFAAVFRSASLASSPASLSPSDNRGTVKKRLSLSLPVSSAPLVSSPIDQFNATFSLLQSPSSPLLSMHRTSLPSTPDLDSLRHSLTDSVAAQHHEPDETESLNLSDNEDGDIDWNLVRAERPALADVLISRAAVLPSAVRFQTRGSSDDLRDLLEELNKETRKGRMQRPLVGVHEEEEDTFGFERA